MGSHHVTHHSMGFAEVFYSIITHFLRTRRTTSLSPRADGSSSLGTRVCVCGCGCAGSGGPDFPGRKKRGEKKMENKSTNNSYMYVHRQ